MISANQARTIRKRVSARLLEPLDFVANGTMYSAHRGGQIHGIAFQASKYGGQFTINLGFHYDFIPAVFSLERKPFSDFGPCDHWLNARLNNFIPGHGAWWTYGDSKGECEATTTNVIQQSLAVLDDYANRWEDTQVLLELCSPPVFERIASEVESETTGYRAFQQILPKWNYEVWTLGFGLVHVALECNEPAIAASYAAAVLNPSDTWRWNWL
jgi:hypothetical protein